MFLHDKKSAESTAPRIDTPETASVVAPLADPVGCDLEPEVALDPGAVLVTPTVAI